MSDVKSQPAEVQEPTAPDSLEELSLLTGFDSGEEEKEPEAPLEEEEEAEVPEEGAEVEEEGEIPQEGDEIAPEEEEPEEVPEEDPEFEWETTSGKKYRVKKSELQKGYMRQDDYQRKTATVAEQRKLADELVKTVKQEREQSANQLNFLIGALHTQLVGDERNLAGLIETDPHEYLRQNAAMNERRAMLQAAYQQQEMLKAQSAEQIAQERRAYVQQQKEQLLQRKPEWRDPKQAAAGSQMVAKYLFDKGFTQDELNSLQDHRLILVALDAAQHEAQQSVKQKKVAAPIKKVLKPGAAAPKSAPVDKNLQRAKEALRRDNRDLDALAALTKSQGF